MFEIATFGAVAPPLVANGYLPVPIICGKKWPPMNDWPGFRADRSALDRYRSYGTGIITGQTIGLDFDIYHDRCAGELRDLAKEMLGWGPVRIGQPPKLLIVYRAAAAFRKLSTAVFVIDGRNCRIEALADGQQFVAFAIHPDTSRPYEWPDRDLLQVPATGLTEVSRNQLVEFLIAAEEVLSSYGERVRQRPARSSSSPSSSARRPPDSSGPRRPPLADEAGWGPFPRYSRAALVSACDAIASAPFGQQEETLNAEAYSIGQLCGAGFMPRSLAIRSLISAGEMMANESGREDWTSREIEWKALRAFTDGEACPRDVPK